MIQTSAGKIDNPAGTPQTGVVVALKGPSYVFSPWELPDRARRRDVYKVCSQGFALLGLHFGRGKPAVTVVRGANAAPIQGLQASPGGGGGGATPRLLGRQLPPPPP